jgi:hypothetical protein
MGFTLCARGRERRAFSPFYEITLWSGTLKERQSVSVCFESERLSFLVCIQLLIYEKGGKALDLRMRDQPRGGDMLRTDQRRTPNPKHASSRDRCNVPGQDIIVDLLNKIEALREHQNLLAWKLKRLLATGHGGSGYEHHKPLSSAELAALRQTWDKFISHGGASAGAAWPRQG